MTEENQETVEQLVPKLMEAYDKELKEYNDLIEELSIVESKNEALNLANALLVEKEKALEEDKEDLSSKLNSLIDITKLVKKQAQLHKDQNEQCQREYTQMQDRYDKQQAILNSYKELGTPKKIRDKIKDYQTKAITSKNGKNALKEEIKIFRKKMEQYIKANNDLHLSLSQSNITTVWSLEGDHLMLFPTALTLSIEGKDEKQLTLLFMNKSGCGRLIGLNQDGEPWPCKYSEGSLEPKEATMEKAGNILRRFKKQNWKISHEDLLSIADM